MRMFTSKFFDIQRCASVFQFPGDSHRLYRPSFVICALRRRKDGAEIQINRRTGQCIFHRFANSFWWYLVFVRTEKRLWRLSTLMSKWRWSLCNMIRQWSCQPLMIYGWSSCKPFFRLLMSMMRCEWWCVEILDISFQSSSSYASGRRWRAGFCNLEQLVFKPRRSSSSKGGAVLASRRVVTGNSWCNKNSSTSKRMREESRW